MRIRRKGLFLLGGLIAFAVAIFAIVNINVLNEEASADTGQVTYYSPVTDGVSTVGDFVINDNIEAWCIEHDKETPYITISVSTLSGYPKHITSSSPENDQLLYKILYYGSMNGYGDVPISLAASYVYTGGRNPVAIYNNNLALYNLAQSSPLPSGEKILNLWTTGLAGYQTLASFENRAIPTTSVTVRKIWSDSNNADGIRPTRIAIQLLRNGTVIDTHNVTGTGNTWTYTWSNLPTRSENGNTNYTYTVNEANVPSGYTKSQNGFTITNTHESTTTATVTKVWDDQNNADRKRPSSITVSLRRDGVHYQNVTVTGTGNTWTATVNGLPRTDGAGHTYAYTFAEPNPPAGYTASVATNGLTITNRYRATTATSVTKVWVDNNNSHNTRPASIQVQLLRNGTSVKTVTLTGGATAGSWTHTEQNLAKYDDAGNTYTYTWRETTQLNNYSMSQSGNTITNTFTNRMNLTVTKTWSDNANAYNTRPGSIQVDLLRNNSVFRTITVTSANGWSATVNDLPIYDDNDVAYSYAWKEHAVTSYVTTVNGNNIINTLSGKTQISMSKVWVDNNNAYNTRPTSVVFSILRNNTEIMTKTLSGSGNTWTATVDDLDKYDANGVEYVYSVAEKTALPAYSSSKTGNTITNTLTGQTSLSGTKTWKDNSNTYGTRPASLELKLFKLLDGTSNKTQVTGVTPTWTKSGNVWNYAFNNLPLYENGVRVEYSVEEVMPAKYVGVQDGSNFVNTVSEKISISGTKTWIYNGAPDRARPTSVNVTLLQNGVEFKTHSVSAPAVDDSDDGSESEERPDTAVWEFTFVNLPKYDDDGVAYAYAIEEEDVTHYKSEITATDLVNTYDPELIKIRVDKIWLNDNEEDRPGEIEVELIRDDEVIDEIELNKDEGWSYEWEGMDPNYDYTVREKFDIPGYYPGVTKGDVEHGFTIENKKIPKNPKTLDMISAAGLIMAGSVAAGAIVLARKRR